MSWMSVSLVVGFLVFVVAGLISTFLEKRKKLAQAKKNLELLREDDKWDERDRDPRRFYVKVVDYLNSSWGHSPFDEVGQVTTKISPGRIGTNQTELQSLREKARQFEARNKLEDLRSGRVSTDEANPLRKLRRSLKRWELELSDIGTTEEELAKLDRQARIQVAKQNLEEFISGLSADCNDFYSIAAISEVIAGTDITLREIANNEEDTKMLVEAMLLLDNLQSLRAR